MGHHYGMSDDEYIQGIIKAEVEKQLKELLKDKTSSRKYIPHTAAEVDVERVI